MLKQIKTVIYPIYESSNFDAEVNKLLAEEWELKKRTFISVKGEPNEIGNVPIIQAYCAELEKYI